MGNICIHDNTKEMPIKKYCYKCGDYFKVDSGGYSLRRSFFLICFFGDGFFVSFGGGG